jgi:hypothetical protein
MESAPSGDRVQAGSERHCIEAQVEDSGSAGIAEPDQLRFGREAERFASHGNATFREIRRD